MQTWIKSEVTPITFIPFDIVIRVESQEELQALYAIFNYADSSLLLPGAYKIIKLLLGGRVGYNEVIANEVRSSDFYRIKVAR